MTSLSRSFIDIIKKNPLLTKEQEVKLSKEAKKGNSLARKKLIESNYRLVISIAKKYHRNNFDFNDLVQESSTGLIKAVDRFDPELGYKFSTYATWWIKEAIIKFINENETSIKVPTHSRILNNNIKSYIKSCESNKGYTPSLEEISKETGENLKKIKYTLKANKSLFYLDNNEEKEDKKSLINKIEDNSVFINPEKNLENKELISIIKNSLKLLSSKEEKIIRLRFGIEESETDINCFPMTEEMWSRINEEVRISK
jgi:RNA polymerase sigma factor (sigma-70 family)